MGISSSIGLISGLDTESIVTSLMNLERRPITDLQQQQSVFQSKISSYGMVKSVLSKLQDSVADLKLSSTFASGYSATSNNEDLLSATISDKASVSEGSYTIKVKQLATSAQMTSNSFTENDSTVGAGTLHFQVGDGEKKSVSIDSDNTSLDDIAKAINDGDLGVSASVIRVADNNYKLSISAKETGKDISFSYQEDGFTFNTTTQAGESSGEIATSKSFNSDSQALGLIGTLTINGNDISLTGTETLNDIQSSVNALSGISAQVNFNSETGTYSLDIENDATEGRVDITFNDADAGSGFSSLIDSGATIAADKALLSINNIDVERDSNTISDLIGGMTLTLNDKDEDKNITLSISSSNTSAEEKISNFVEAFNSTVTTLDSLQKYDSGSKAAGNLLGDSTTNVLRAGIRRMIFSQVDGLSSDVNTLNELGIRVEESGQLSFDKAKFASVMKDDPDNVESFFKGDSNLTKGFAVKFNSFLNGYLQKNNGILSAKIDGYNRSSSRIDSSIEKYEARLDKREDTLRKQYANLEQVLSTYTSTASYLSSQLSSLSNMTDGFYK